jgi:hypothetical protein
VPTRPSPRPVRRPARCRSARGAPHAGSRDGR